MGTLLSYSGLSTKIRAMQSKLMTEKQYQEISQLESVPQVVAYLKKQPGFKELWTDLDENSLHRVTSRSCLPTRSIRTLLRFTNSPIPPSAPLWLCTLSGTRSPL